MVKSVLWGGQEVEISFEIYLRAPYRVIVTCHCSMWDFIISQFYKQGEKLTDVRLLGSNTWEKQEEDGES